MKIKASAEPRQHQLAKAVGEFAAVETFGVVRVQNLYLFIM